MKKIFLLILVATLACSQAVRRNQLMFSGSASNITVGSGASVTTAVSVGTTRGLLKRIVVQHTGGITAGSSSNFDVRICVKGSGTSGGSTLCDTEDANSIYQKQNNTTTGSYPFGLYQVQDILWANKDTPTPTQVLYVRITNNTGGSTAFDIYLEGVVVEGPQ